MRNQMTDVNITKTEEPITSMILNIYTANHYPTSCI